MYDVDVSQVFIHIVTISAEYYLVKMFEVVLLTNFLSLLLCIAFLSILTSARRQLKGCALQLGNLLNQDGGHFRISRVAACGVYPYDVYGADCQDNAH